MSGGILSAAQITGSKYANISGGIPVRFFYGSIEEILRHVTVKICNRIP